MELVSGTLPHSIFVSFLLPTLWAQLTRSSRVHWEPQRVTLLLPGWLGQSPRSKRLSRARDFLIHGRPAQQKLHENWRTYDHHYRSARGTRVSRVAYLWTKTRISGSSILRVTKSGLGANRLSFWQLRRRSWTCRTGSRQQMCCVPIQGGKLYCSTAMEFRVIFYTVYIPCSSGRYSPRYLSCSTILWGTGSETCISTKVIVTHF